MNLWFNSFSVTSTVGCYRLHQLEAAFLLFQDLCQSPQSLGAQMVPPFSLPLVRASITHLLRFQINTCVVFLHRPLQSSLSVFFLAFFKTVLCHNAAQKLGSSQVSSVLRQLPTVMTNVALLYLYTPTSICLFSHLFFLKLAAI